MNVTYLIDALIATAISYMAFPLIRLLINGGKFDKKSAKRIALWNSIVVGAVFYALFTKSNPNGTWSCTTAFTYYWINKSILTEK